MLLRRTYDPVQRWSGLGSDGRLATAVQEEKLKNAAHELAAGSDVVEVVAPNVVLVAHWARLRDRVLYATGPRLDGAT